MEPSQAKIPPLVSGANQAYLCPAHSAFTPHLHYALQVCCTDISTNDDSYIIRNASCLGFMGCPFGSARFPQVRLRQRVLTHQQSRGAAGPHRSTAGLLSSTDMAWRM